MNPIFFAATKSFWFTVAGLAMVLEQGEPVIRSIATIVVALSYQIGWTLSTDTLTQWALDIMPAVLWIAAMQQRTQPGARPYTINPGAK